MSYDVIVIGGGISGCAAAYYLSSAGHKVALVEKDGLASHASGFAFGYLAGSRSVPDGSGAFDRMRAFSVGLHHELASTLPELTGEKYHFENKAGLVLAFDESEAAELKSVGKSAFLRDEWPAEREDIRWLAYGELSHIEARVSTDVIGALYLGYTVELSPSELTRALWAGASKAHGATLLMDEVIEITVSNGAATGVLTSEGSVSAGSVVLAAGPWSDGVLQRGSATSHLGLPVTPLKGQILRYDIGEQPPMPVSIWWGDDYASSKPDGLLYVGTTEEDVGFDEEPSDLAREWVARSAVKALPFLSEAPIARQTACLRPLTTDRMPIVGAMDDVEGLFVATGGGRVGIEIGPILGWLIANTVSGDRAASAPYSSFSPARFA